MKQAFFILLLTLLNKEGFTQHAEEFVEVIVTDTIQSDPEEIIYTLYCHEGRGISEVTEKFSGKTSTLQKPVKKQETPAEKIRDIIKTQTLDTVEATQYTFENEMYGDSYTNMFNLRFTSGEKLEIFLRAMHGIKGVTGFISEKKTSKNDVLTQLLTNRLLQKAAINA